MSRQSKDMMDFQGCKLSEQFPIRATIGQSSTNAARLARQQVASNGTIILLLNSLFAYDKPVLLSTTKLCNNIIIYESYLCNG